MFEKFSEFDSVEEINREAAVWKAKGDMETLRALALENGLDKEDTEDYINGDADELTRPFPAAVGKLEAEAKELEIAGILEDWKDTIIEICMEDKELCAAVRKKGKRLAECMAKLIQFAFENKVKVSDKIVNITKVHHNGKLEEMRKPLYLGVPNRTETEKITREYYMG